MQKTAEGEIARELFAFLTTDVSVEVSAIHPRTMPDILTTPQEVETELAAPWVEATALQHPLADVALIVAAKRCEAGHC